jgi:hypothetical protein
LGFYTHHLGTWSHGAASTEYYGTVGACTYMAVTIAFVAWEPVTYQSQMDWFEHPLKLCGYCQTPNQPIPGLSKGWQKDPVRGEYCDDGCKWAANKDHQRNLTP